MKIQEQETVFGKIVATRRESGELDLRMEFAERVESISINVASDHGGGDGSPADVALRVLSQIISLGWQANLIEADLGVRINWYDLASAIKGAEFRRDDYRCVDDEDVTVTVVEL